MAMMILTTSALLLIIGVVSGSPLQPKRLKLDDNEAGKCTLLPGSTHHPANPSDWLGALTNVTAPADCCAACSQRSGCGAFVANVSGCFLKKFSWIVKASPGTNSTAGVVAATPPRPPSPAPPPPPPPSPPTPPTPPPAPAPPGVCRLRASGSIEATRDGEMIELLNITTDPHSTAPGIMIQGKKNVVVRNVHITHTMHTAWPYGVGLLFQSAPNITIINVSVELVGQKNASGPTVDSHNYNVWGVASPGPTLSNVRTTGGSTGIELSKCPQAILRRTVGVNMRGPYPRGQCIQVDDCDGTLIEDFYCTNDNSSWVEDNLSIYRSSNVTVRRGLVDGNNSPTGVGVMFEQDDPTKSGGLLEDVDAVHMGDGCFSMYGGTDIVFNRVRCRDNHCAGWSGRSKPTSGSLMIYAGDENGVNTTGGRLRGSVYSRPCQPGHVIASQHAGAWVEQDLTEQEFDLRSPVEVTLCWDHNRRRR